MRIHSRCPSGGEATAGRDGRPSLASFHRNYFAFDVMQQAGDPLAMPHWSHFGASALQHTSDPLICPHFGHRAAVSHFSPASFQPEIPPEKCFTFV